MAIEQLWLFWLAPITGAILGGLYKWVVAEIAASLDSAATASDLAEAPRG
jgi:hypothetical protein